MVEIVLEFQTGRFFVLPRLFSDLIPAVDESEQPVDQRVDKFVLIGLQRFLAEHVENLGRDDLIPVDLRNQVGMLRQMLQRPHRDIVREFDGQYLVPLLDELGRIADNDVQRGQRILYDIDPHLVDGAQQIAFAQFDGSAAALHHAQDHREDVIFLHDPVYEERRIIVDAAEGIFGFHALCHAPSPLNTSSFAAAADMPRTLSSRPCRTDCP